MTDNAHFKQTQNIYQNIGIALVAILFASVLGDNSATEIYVDFVRRFNIPPLLLFSPATMGFVYLLLFVFVLAIPATSFHLWVANRLTRS